jgi:hypothetical protein
METPDYEIATGPCAHCRYTAVLTQFYRRGRTFELCSVCFLTVRAGLILLGRLEDLGQGDEGVLGLLQ